MKIGIAGCGFMGEVHAENYKKLGFDIYAVGESNTQKRNNFSNKFSPTKVYNNVFAMIEDAEIDLIDICLPTSLHKITAVAALQNNKHVLLEKPIALSLEDAFEIKNAAEQSTGKFMVAHVLRFWPQYSIIRKFIKEKKLGNIKEIYASRFNELPLWSEGTWIMDEEKSGGIIIDLMIHDIDFVMWNLGKVVKVWAEGITNEKGFFIQAMTIIKFENGATTYIEGGYLNSQGTGLNSQMRVYGDKALLEMYSHENYIRLTKKGGEKKTVEIHSTDGYYEEISYFVNCINKGENPRIVTINGAIENLRVCLALKKSLETGNWIEL